MSLQVRIVPCNLAHHAEVKVVDVGGVADSNHMVLMHTRAVGRGLALGPHRRPVSRRRPPCADMSMAISFVKGGILVISEAGRGCGTLRFSGTEACTLLVLWQYFQIS